MTSRAKDMALTTVVSPETAPHLLVPSIIEASISTVPSLVKTDPLPALKFGLFSSSRTCTWKIINCTPQSEINHEQSSFLFFVLMHNLIVINDKKKIYVADPD